LISHKVKARNGFLVSSKVKIGENALVLSGKVKRKSPPLTAMLFFFNFYLLADFGRFLLKLNEIK
jgi:hypothetical protein